MGKKSCAYLLILCIVCCLAGCGQTKNKPPASFSALDWDASPDAMRQAHGDETESYPSVYGGTTYVYGWEYEGRNGTLKYMFDAEEKLMCIAWAYETADADDLDAVYEKLHKEVEDAKGESGYNPSGSTNYGDVWYLEDGDIIISAVTAENQYALQYAYLNPAVSNKEASGASTQ